MRADTGPIGGELSHEFIILAETGESGVFCDPDWLDADVLAQQIGFNDDLEPFFRNWTSLYAATDEIHDPAACPVPAERLIETRGIEVGHIFSFGTKYSVPMNATVTGPDGRQVPLVMGSYGIGVSRLVGAIIESSHDDKGIVWPAPVAPFDLSLINLKPSDAAARAAADLAYDQLGRAGLDVLYDDRELAAGAKFADADLVGLPHQLILGPRGVAKGMAEIKHRKTGERSEIPLDRIVDHFARPA
jgi:prolyl-tRNA synthetase